MAYSQGKTSFIMKCKNQTPQISGTMPSLRNNLLLTSTGTPSVDQAVGFLPVGSVMLIEEGRQQSYAHVLMKYFLAEGVQCGHDILFSSADVNVKTFIDTLPSPIEAQSTETESPTTDELKIAWRYEKNIKRQNKNKCSIGRNFDVTKTISAEKLAKVDVVTFDPLANLDDLSCPFKQLTKKIETKINEGGFSATSDPLPSKILRIGIIGLGSPFWPCETDENQRATLRFLHNLRFLLRSSCAAALITVPSFLWEGSSFISRMRHFCDTVFRLDSFAASERKANPAYKDFHGLFFIEKIPQLNSLTSHHQPARDLAFKLGKRKFLVDKLHLPPLEAEEPRIQNFCTSKPGGNKLDF